MYIGVVARVLAPTLDFVNQNAFAIPEDEPLSGGATRGPREVPPYNTSGTRFEGRRTVARPGRVGRPRWFSPRISMSTRASSPSR